MNPSEQEKQPRKGITRHDKTAGDWMSRLVFLSDHWERPGATFLLIMSVLFCTEWFKTPGQKTVFNLGGFFIGFVLWFAVCFIVAGFPTFAQSLIFYLLGFVMGGYLSISRSSFGNTRLVIMLFGYLLVDLLVVVVRRWWKSRFDKSA